jgi:hypothetical protein
MTRWVPWGSLPNRVTLGEVPLPFWRRNLPAAGNNCFAAFPERSGWFKRPTPVWQLPSAL